MARRGNRDDVVEWVPGYKLEYGTLPTGSDAGASMELANLVTEKNAMSAEFAAKAAAPLIALDASTVINPAAWGPGNPDGLRAVSDDMYDIISWFQLEYIQRAMRNYVKRMKPYFEGLTIPRTVDALYVTLYFAFKETSLAAQAGCYFSVSLPVIGSTKREAQIRLVVPIGETG